MRRPPRRARQHLVPTPRARAYALKLTSPPPPSRLSSHSFRSAQVVLVNVAARRPDWPVSTIILEHGLGSRAPTTTSAFNYDPRSIAGLFALDASISTPPPSTARRPFGLSKFAEPAWTPRALLEIDSIPSPPLFASSSSRRAASPAQLCAHGPWCVCHLCRREACWQSKVAGRSAREQ